MAIFIVELQNCKLVVFVWVATKPVSILVICLLTLTTFILSVNQIDLIQKYVLLYRFSRRYCFNHLIKLTIL